jgi:hypothetical protein
MDIGLAEQPEPPVRCRLSRKSRKTHSILHLLKSEESLSPLKNNCKGFLFFFEKKIEVLSKY